MSPVRTGTVAITPDNRVQPHGISHAFELRRLRGFRHLPALFLFDICSTDMGERLNVVRTLATSATSK